MASAAAKFGPNGTNLQQDRNCPICRTAAAAQLFSEANVDPARLDQFAFASRKLPEYMHHRLMICKTCDLVYASPVPAPDELHEAYAEAAFDSGTENNLCGRTYEPGSWIPTNSSLAPI